MKWKNVVLTLTVLLAVLLIINIVSPASPSGLATGQAQQGKVIKVRGTPDHSLLIIVLLLGIGAIGAHFLGHCCKKPGSKKILITSFVIAFLTLGGIFGFAFASPDASIASNVKQVASIIAALLVIVLFSITAFEMRASDKHQPESSEIQKQLEEADEEWEGP